MGGLVNKECDIWSDENGTYSREYWHGSGVSLRQGWTLKDGTKGTKWSSGLSSIDNELKDTHILFQLAYIKRYGTYVASNGTVYSLPQPEPPPLPKLSQHCYYPDISPIRPPIEGCKTTVKQNGCISNKLSAIRPPIAPPFVSPNVPPDVCSICSSSLCILFNGFYYCDFHLPLDEEEEEEIEENLDDRMCSICMDDFNQRVMLDCGHSFCLNCIGNWSKEQSTCPLCRREL